MDYTQTASTALAYLGDSVLELLVREYLVRKGLEKSAHLNEEAKKFVTAVAQNEAFLRIENELTEEEKGVFNRGKNCSHLTVPKSAKASEYRNATGFECIFGYLHLQNERARIQYLFEKAYQPILGKDEK